MLPVQTSCYMIAGVQAVYARLTDELLAGAPCGREFYVRTNQPGWHPVWIAETSVSLLRSATAAISADHVICDTSVASSACVFSVVCAAAAISAPVPSVTSLSMLLPVPCVSSVSHHHSNETDSMYMCRCQQS